MVLAGTGTDRSRDVNEANLTETGRDRVGLGLKCKLCPLKYINPKNLSEHSSCDILSTPFLAPYSLARTVPCALVFLGLSTQQVLNKHILHTGQKKDEK